MPQSTIMHTLTEGATSYAIGGTGIASGGILQMIYGITWADILLVCSSLAVTARFIFDCVRFCLFLKDRRKEHTDE